MGKNKDIESAANILIQVVVHNIIPDFTNKPESVPHMKQEEIAYRAQSFKKLSAQNWNESDKQIIKSLVTSGVQKKLNNKYPDVKIPQDVVLSRIKEQLDGFFSEI